MIGCLLVAALAVAEPVPQRAVYEMARKQFGELALPAGSAAEPLAGPGLRLRLPAGRWPGTLFWGAHQRAVPRVVRAVEGDFMATARVRLAFDRTAGAAGVTTVEHGPEGVRAVSTPAVTGGLHVTGSGVGFAEVTVEATRRGDERELRPAFQMSSRAGGAGGRFNGADDFAPAVRITLRRVGETVTVAGGLDDVPERDWSPPFTYKVVMSPRVEVRLFATGNLDKPFSVEFDRLSVTPLPAEGKE